ncbi:hypothetical protein ACFFX0_15160 [Citricoccus parietis]|uniref:Uncharacterized protein n=1 Tax=Citricoccus parietis TaxID=592307 RepID=A0ABV5G0J6_9MICC
MGLGGVGGQATFGLRGQRGGEGEGSVGLHPLSTAHLGVAHLSGGADIDGLVLQEAAAALVEAGQATRADAQVDAGRLGRETGTRDGDLPAAVGNLGDGDGGGGAGGQSREPERGEQHCGGHGHPAQDASVNGGLHGVLSERTARRRRRGPSKGASEMPAERITKRLCGAFS